MTLMRFDPFRELDRLGERMLGGPAMRAMPTEAYRRGDSFYVLIDVPGVDPDELQVTVERNVVSAHASRRSPAKRATSCLLTSVHM
ncbi:MAG TPA: Hsp20 family protein, partial [Propionibacteriaceae bacterium]|nr:Hsp20 family protein [Propionibacteriaceae bacterium]